MGQPQRERREAARLDDDRVQESPCEPAGYRREGAVPRDLGAPAARPIRGLGALNEEGEHQRRGEAREPGAAESSRGIASDRGQERVRLAVGRVEERSQRLYAPARALRHRKEGRGREGEEQDVHEGEAHVARRGSARLQLREELQAPESQLAREEA